MSADRAALALAELADSSGAAEYMRGIYGAGVLYRAFAALADVDRFIGEPRIDDSVLYHTRERVGLFGDVALGAVAAARPNDVIVVIDVVDAQTRTTYSKLGSNGGRPTTMSMPLVPLELDDVEALPRPLDDASTARVEAAVRVALVACNDDHLSSVERTLYFIDWSKRANDDADNATPERVPAEHFLEFVASLRADESLPASLRTLFHVYETHNPVESVVVWVRSPAFDSVWLVNRVVAATDSPPSAGGGQL